MEVPTNRPQLEFMKNSSLIAGILAAGITAYAHDSKPADVTVYVNGDNLPPSSVDFGARATVTWVFARVGVRLAWKAGDPKPVAASGSPGTIRIRFTKEAPAVASRNALAYALPFGEGVQITVMYGRIREAAQESRREQPILAHVLAHEISHVLQGIDRHSKTGVMKAWWNQQDYDAMQQKPLEFTPFDVTLIQGGLSARKAKTPTFSAVAR